MKNAREIEDTDFSLIIGIGGHDDPIIAFCDAQRLITYEQYNEHGDRWGWKTELIENEAEYFRRKLKGK